MYKFLGTRALYRAGQAGRGRAPAAGVASVPGTQWRGPCRRGRAGSLADVLRGPALCPRAAGSSRWASVSPVKGEGRRVCLPGRGEGEGGGGAHGAGADLRADGSGPARAHVLGPRAAGCSAPAPSGPPVPHAVCAPEFHVLPHLISTVWLMGA